MAAGADDVSSALSWFSSDGAFAAAESLAGAAPPLSALAAELSLSFALELSPLGWVAGGVFPVAGVFAGGVVGALDGAALGFAGGCAVPAAGCGCTGAGCVSGVIDGVEDAGEAPGALFIVPPLVVSGAFVAAAAGFFAKTFSQGKP